MTADTISGSLPRRGPMVLTSFALVALLAFQLILYWPAWQSMFSVWDTPTYTHGYLVPLVTLYLVWDRRAELSHAIVKPWPVALIGVGAAGLLWLAGNLAGVNAAQHFGIVAMLPFVTAALFGLQVTRLLMFPLAFLVFAVPFGDFLLAPMMDLTAAVTIFLVKASGIPIYREGLSFMLPTGSWSVIEECSGQRYLIAATPLACLFAYLSFQHLRTRIQFVLFAVAVALVANWLRAYLIVMIGHFSGMTLATGVDHLIYGWLFFGIVMAVVFWIGSRWQEPKAAVSHNKSTLVPASGIQRRQSSPGAFAVTLMAGALLGLLAAWPALSMALIGVRSAPLALESVVNSESGFQVQNDYPVTQFRPSYAGMRSEIYALASDKRTTAWIGQFEQQGPGREMIGANQIVTSRPGDNGWRISLARNALELPGGVRPMEYEVYRGDERLRLWHWYFIDGRSTASPQVAKVLTALRVIRGRGDQSLVVSVWTPLDDDPAASAERLRAASLRLIESLGRRTGQ